jgi:AraC-like DNA-binding protein
MSRPRVLYAKPPLASPRLRIRGFGIRDRLPPGTVDRPRGTGDYLMLCPHGPLDLGEAGTAMAAGEVVLWEPGQRQLYRARGSISHSWLLCDGSLVASHVRNSNLPTAQAMAPGSARAVVRALRELLRELQAPFPAEDIAATILQGLFLNLARNQRRLAGSGLPEPYAGIVREIDAGADRRLHLAGLARRAGKSERQFTRTFRALVGESPIAYQQRLRLQHAGFLLHDVERSVGEVAAAVGYQDLFQFSRAFARHFGCSPRAWRKQPPPPPVADSRDQARWGAPLVEERFGDDGWRARWLEMSDGTWRRDGERIVTCGPGGSVLINQRRFEAPCAIEYSAEITPGSSPSDLSCVWWEGDDLVANRGRFFDYDHPGYMVQFGAHSNSYSTIHRNPGAQRVSFSTRCPVPGRVHAIRVEIEHDAVRAYVDGELWLEHRDLFPAASGYFALYGYFPGKAFFDVRIWSKGVPERISVLAIGDDAYLRGNWRAAARAWRRVMDSHPDTPLAADAQLRTGLAEWRSGDRPAAEAAWRGLTGMRADLAATMRLEGAWEYGDIAGFVRSFTALWRTQPAMRARLGALWSVCVASGLGLPPLPREPGLRAMLALREAVFPDDEATAIYAAHLLIDFGRAADVLTLTTQVVPVVEALRALGRNREILARKGAVLYERQMANLALGRIDDALALEPLLPWDRGFILAKAGRHDQARLHGDQALVGVLCGDPAPTLATAPDAPAVNTHAELADAARLQLGQVAIAADRPVHRDGCWIAQALLRREDRPERWWGSRALLHQARWVRALEDTGAADPALTAAVEADAIAHDRWGGWFIPWFALPFIAGRLAGRAGAAALARLARQTDGTFAQRPHFLALLLAGRTTRTAFLAQPIRSEAEAWHAIGTALRAELDGDAAGARRAWQAYAALPMQRRLLDRYAVEPLVERFARWRLDVLASAS